MSDMVASSPQGKAAAVPPGGDRADGLSITDGTFNGKVVSFDNLGVALPGGGGPFITSSVYDDGKVRRRNGTRYFRRRIGWQAQRDRIVLVIMEQDLAPRPDGRFSSSGSWNPASVRVFPAQGATKRRVGDVPRDPDTAATAATMASDPPVPADEKNFSRAHHDLRYLPAAVRTSFLKYAAQPTDFYVEALRYGDDSALSRHTVTGLRMNTQEAIVVLASLQRNARSWQVEQVRYSLRHLTDLERG